MTPLVPVLCVFAAFAVLDLAGRLRGPSWRPWVVAVLAAGAMVEPLEATAAHIKLTRLTRRLQQTLARLDGLAEILFVNDGSVDGTLSILKALQFEDKRIRLISLSRNFGHQAAVTAGLAYAAGEAVAILDGDLQDPPELLSDLFRKVDEGWDVDEVVGFPSVRSHEARVPPLPASPHDFRRSGT